MEYMTEGEARGKWCPAARQLATSSSGSVCAINRSGTFPGIEGVFMAGCIASGCMWWREERDDYGEGYADNIEPGRGRCGMVR